MDISSEFLSFLLAGALTPIVTELVFASVLSRRRDQARKDPRTGELVLEYGRSVRRVPFAAGLFWAVFLPLIVLWQGFPAGEDLVWLAFIMAFVATPLAALTVETHGVQHRVSEVGFQKGSPWSRDYFLPWPEVQRISFNRNASGYVIRSWRGKIRISMVLDGLQDFLHIARRNVPPDRWQNAAQG